MATPDVATHVDDYLPVLCRLAVRHAVDMLKAGHGADAAHAWLLHDVLTNQAHVAGIRVEAP
jgi:hypothetical protein